jgi:hypothetical protein
MIDQEAKVYLTLKNERNEKCNVYWINSYIVFNTMKIIFSKIRNKKGNEQTKQFFFSF